MANRPSQLQTEALVEFLEQNPGIARGLLRTQQAKVETKRKWHEFATAANAMGGVMKDGPAWAKYWAEKKSALKKLCQQRAQSMRRTGGGMGVAQEPSLIEQRLVAIMGGDSFATGSTGLAVDPFPQTDTQSPSIMVEYVNQPSTSAVVDSLPEGLQVDVDIQNPHPPADLPQVEAELQVDESEQQHEINFAPPTESRRAPRLVQQSRQTRRVSFLDSQVRRFEEIESRRVEAEMLNAQTLAQIPQSLAQIAEAQVQTAQALVQLAAAVREAGEHISAAVQHRN